MEFIQSNTTNFVIVAGIVISLILLGVHVLTKSRQSLNFISTSWISLGILGTFVSIYSSLKHVEGNMEGMVDSLIDSISPAFETSIIGISVALLCQIMIKIYYSIIEKRESSLVSSSPEECLYDISTSMKTFEEFIKGWNAMTDGFVKKLDEFYESLNKEETQRSENITVEYMNALSSMIKQSENKADAILEDSFSTHVEKINFVLDIELKKIKEIMELYNSKLSDTAHSGTQAIQSLQDTLIQQSEESSRRILQKAEEFEEKMLVDKDNRVIEQLNQFEKQITLLMEQWKMMMQNGTAEFRNALLKMGDYNASTLVELNRTSEVLKEICSQLTILNFTVAKKQ